MKILYVVHQFYPAHYTGTERFVLNLSTTIQKWGHKVKVMTYSFYDMGFYDSSADGFHSKQFIYKGIPVFAIQHKQPIPPDLDWGVENPSLARYAESLLVSEKPDLVHVAHPMRMAEFAAAARRLGIPYVATLTDFFLMCPKSILFTSKGTLCSGPEKGEACKQFCPQFQDDVVTRRLAKTEYILRNAACVAAPSKFLGALFKNEFPWLNRKVVPYGIDYSHIERNTRAFNGNDKLVILYAGQLDYHKGVPILIDAVRRSKMDKFVVKLYGSGPPTVERQLREMAKGEKRVEFCGVYKKEQMSEVFNSADVVVVPSMWHENNTIVMLEALASNIPCIVSNGGGMVEQIQDGVNGFIVRMGDAEHLKDTIERIVKQPRLLSEMKKNVNAYAVTTVEQEAYAYEEEYSRIVANR